MQGLYCPCSENKGADQLRCCHEADLCLCFRICKKPVFSRCGSYIIILVVYNPHETMESDPKSNVEGSVRNSTGLNLQPHDHNFQALTAEPWLRLILILIMLN